MSYVLDALTLWDGADGDTAIAGSPHALVVLHHFDMRDQGPSGMADNFGGRACDTLGTVAFEADGPDQNDSPVGIDTSAGGGFEMEAVGDLLSTMNAANNGLFICVAVRKGVTANRNPLINAWNAAYTRGFWFALESAGLSYNPGTVSLYVANGGNVQSKYYSGADTMSDEQFHIWSFYFKNPSVARIWLDGMPLTLSTITNNNIGNFPTGVTDKLALSAVSNGTYTPTVGTNDHHYGGMGHLVIVHGCPTQTQMRDLCRAMFYSVRGIPGVIQHLKPSPSTCCTDTAGTAPAAEGDPVKFVLDLSPGTNSASNQAFSLGTADNVPTLEYSLNGNRWALCFDNFFSDYNVYSADARFKQQTLQAAVAGKIIQRHFGAITVCRSAADYRQNYDAQNVMEFRDGTAGTIYNAFGVHPTTHTVGHFRGVGAQAPTSGAKFLVGGRSLGILGVSTGQVGLQTSASDVLILNNRFQYTLAAGLSADTTLLDTINIGGPKDQEVAGGGRKNWSGMLEESIVTKCGFTPAEALAFVEDALSEAGEMATPDINFFVIGDSIPNGIESLKCQTMLGLALPASASQRASFRYYTVPSAAVEDSVAPYASSLSMVMQALADGRGFDTAAGLNIVLGEVETNDANAGDSKATFKNEMWSNGADLPSIGGESKAGIKGLLDQLWAGGADAIYWNKMAGNISATPATAPCNLALDELLAEGRLSGLVTLRDGTYVDGPHPSAATQIDWGTDWWQQAIAGLVSVMGSSSGMAAQLPALAMVGALGPRATPTDRTRATGR